MSLSYGFNLKASKPVEQKPAQDQAGKRPAPFSLRLSEEERAGLVREASGTPLGIYIKAKVLERHEFSRLQPALMK